MAPVPQTARTALIAVGAVAAVLFALLAIKAAGSGVLPTDWALHDALLARGLGPWALAVPRALAVLGSAWAGPIWTLGIVAVFWRWIGWRPAALVAVAASVALATVVIKTLVDRPRPPGALLTDPGFPSGHTAYATAVLGVTAIILLAHRRGWWAALCALVIVLMGPSRVAIEAHWASDVAGGYLLGITWLCAILALAWTWWANPPDEDGDESAER